MKHIRGLRLNHAVAPPHRFGLSLEPAGAHHRDVGEPLVEALRDREVVRVARKVNVAEEVFRVVASDGNLAESRAVAHEGGVVAR